MPLKSLISLWVMIADTFQISPMSLLRIQRSTSVTFFTITMPQMGKILDKSLTHGGLLSFSGITKVYKGTMYPVFLREMFEAIFHKDGLLRVDCDPLRIRQLRTLLFMFYKYEQQPSDEQLSDAAVKFRTTDDMVKTDFSGCDLDKLRSVFKLVFDKIDPSRIVGRHSNGATEGGYNNDEKRNNFRIIPSLCNYYDLRYFFNNPSHYKWHKENFGTPVIVEPSARVAFVPKDSRGPRTICIEPHERMYMQQGVMTELYTVMESLRPFRGRVNFTDQSINGRIALSSSYDRKYATLDLKDASDLVSWELIKQIVPLQWVAPLSALRTPTACLPDKSIVEMKKFAPMGSALCFPIEALLFFAICYQVSHDVYVYGDDIICPTDKAQQCICMLEAYGLRVNMDKSLYYGDFRESCGIDAFRGSIITPIRYRRDDLVSVVAFANNLSNAFNEHTGEAVIRWYESINHQIIPRLSHDYEDSGAIAFYTSSFSNECLFSRRYNRQLQIHELRLLSVCPTDRERSKDTYGHLYDSLSLSYRVNTGFDNLHCHDPWKRTKPNWSVNDRLTLVRTRVKYRWVREISRG